MCRKRISPRKSQGALASRAAAPAKLLLICPERLRWSLEPGLVITALALHNTLVAMAGLTLAAASASTCQSSFWTVPANILAGAAAAAGIALINSLGNIGGFASTFLVGWMTDLTHSAATSLYLFAGFLVIGALLLLTIPVRMINK